MQSICRAELSGKRLFNFGFGGFYEVLTMGYGSAISKVSHLNVAFMVYAVAEHHHGIDKTGNDMNRPY